MKKSILTVLIIVLFQYCYSAIYYVSTNGSPSNNGSFSSPWSFSHAITSGSGVVAGDTIFVRGGTYLGGLNSTISGNSSAPIIIKNYNNERAIIDCNGTLGITISGSYTWFWGLEVTSLKLARNSAQSGSAPSDIPTESGFTINGHHSKVINCIVYNVVGSGFGYWKHSTNSEVYGCLIFNNGWQGTDRGHGHGLYIQNKSLTARKAVRNCFVFNQAGNGIQIYTTNPPNLGIEIEKNTSFNTSAIRNANMERKHNLVINSANNVSQEIIVTNNIFYRDSTDNSTNNTLGKNVKLGFSGSPDSNIIFNNNHVFGGSPVVEVKKWQAGEFFGNTISNFNKSGSANNQLVDLAANTTLGIPWDNNDYFSHNPSGSSLFDGETFVQWQTRHSHDNNSSFTASWPVNNYVYVNQNTYEPNKFHVSVLNYKGLNNVILSTNDISIPIGEKYYVRDVQNYLGAIVDSGIMSINGINLPMNLSAVHPVTGDMPLQAKHTDVYLGTFIIEGDYSATTSIGYEFKEMDFNWVYNSENFIYKGERINEKCFFKLYDIKGNLVMSQNFVLEKNKSISIPKYLNKGIYFSVFESFDNYTAKKILIHK